MSIQANTRTQIHKVLIRVQMNIDEKRVVRLSGQCKSLPLPTVMAQASYRVVYASLYSFLEVDER